MFDMSYFLRAFLRAWYIFLRAVGDTSAQLYVLTFVNTRTPPNFLAEIALTCYILPDSSQLEELITVE